MISNMTMFYHNNSGLLEVFKNMIKLDQFASKLDLNNEFIKELSSKVICPLDPQSIISWYILRNKMLNVPKKER